MGFSIGDVVMIGSELEKKIESIAANTITFSEGLSVDLPVGADVAHPGRDELDLMRLILGKPENPEGGSVVLSVLKGEVRLWKESSKNNMPIALTEQGTASFSVDDIPETGKTIWVELIQKSGEVRDVELESDYGGAKDLVKATGVWAERQQFVTTGKRLKDDGTPNFPGMDDEGINVIIKDNGDVFGSAEMGDRIGCAKLVEYKVFPTKIGAESAVQFDLTRQAADRNNVLTYAGKFIALDSAPLDKFPAQAESGTDDPNSVSEDSTPSTPTEQHPEIPADLIYDFDSPADLRLVPSSLFRARFISFREFVRVRFDGAGFKHGTTPADRAPQGSRCSERDTWHAQYYLRWCSDQKYEFDTVNPSASGAEPEGAGNASIGAPSAGVNAVTELWTVTFSSSSNEWIVVGTKSGAQANIAKTGEGYSSDDGKVSFAITVGSPPSVSDGFKFTFATFRTERPEGKKTFVGIGPIDIGGEP